jgi:hypothetical protein
MSDTPQSTAQLQTAFADNNSGDITAQGLRNFVVSVLNKVDIPISSFIQTLLDDANAAAAQATLGLGTAAVLNVPATGNATSGQVVIGTDTRLSDSRTPSTHASTHASGGSDPVSLNASQITAGSLATARLGTGTANSSCYLQGDGTWQSTLRFSALNACNGLLTSDGNGNVVAHSLQIGSTFFNASQANGTITAMNNAVHIDSGGDLTAASLTSAGNLQVNGNQINDSNGNGCIYFDGSGNTQFTGYVKVVGDQLLDGSGNVCVSFDGSGNTTIAGTCTGTFSGDGSGLTGVGGGYPGVSSDGNSGLTMNNCGCVNLQANNAMSVSGGLEITGTGSGSAIQDSAGNQAIIFPGDSTIIVPGGLNAPCSINLNNGSITVDSDNTVTLNSCFTLTTDPILTIANLPTSDPHNANQIWNNSGQLMISAG